ncbi:hypothetical protein FOZ60_016471 [Perkinsus olseni]|uniref:Reverse transcriptase domain-containing protein n=1 Tax=Perkinsus olseni TaxID=32597 RepID=A0A7J6P4H4_PEROL|nr:hypothetical protein FOZ60_016471 [Perkinsus olseni]
MDVQDTFMQLRAGVGLQRFLGLYHRGGTLVFTRVPYGLAISPHILEVAVRHVVGRLITAGVLPDCQVKILHYMDDVFLLSTRSLTPTEVSTLTGRVVDLFARYSLPMSPKKTIVLFDTAKVNALGLEYIDHGKFVRFPLPRWQALFHIDLDRTWTYRTVLSHLGMLTAESDVLPEHCLEQRNLLQGLLASERHRLQRALTDTISPILGVLLREWLLIYRDYAEPPHLCRFINAALPTTVYTDASQYALAYKIYQDGHLILQGQRVLRRRTERALHANVLELYAVYFALSRLILYESLAKVHFAHLTLFTDNKTALSCLRTLRTKSTNPVGQQAFLQRKLGQCIELVGLVRFNTIRFDYVDTTANPADSATRSLLTARLLDRFDNPLSTSTTSGQELAADLGQRPVATSLVQRAAILQVLPTPWLATDLVSAIQDYRRLHRLFHAFRPIGTQSDLPADLCFFRARQRDSSRLSEYVDYLSSPSRGHSPSLRKATQHLVVSPSGLLLRHVLYDVYGQIVPQVALHDDDHKELIHDIIHHFHCVGGHLGIKATRHLVERYFWSPKLRHAVRRYVKQCQPCLLTQQSRAWHSPSTYPAPSRPFQTLGLDLTGPYHTAVWHTASFKVVLTATDLLTKYTVLIPLANGTLSEVLHGLRSVTWS